MPALLISARTGRRSGSRATRRRCDHIRFNGDVEDVRLDPVGPQRLGVGVTADTGQHVKALGRVPVQWLRLCSRGAGHDDQLCRWGFAAFMTISKFKLTTSSENYQLS